MCSLERVKLSMGGFYYGKEERPVTLNDVPKLLTSLAKVRAIDIKDKSKGDALSKAFVVLQISWFVVQCYARAIRKLPITLLEMSALSFAVLSIASYAAWWEKPVNVQYQIRLEEHSSMDTRLDGPHEVPASLDVDPEPTAALSPARRSTDNPDNSPGGNSSNPIELLPLPNTASFKPTAGYSSRPHNSPLMDIESSPGPEVCAESSLYESLKDALRIHEHLVKRAMRPFKRIYSSIVGFIFRDDIGIASGADRPVLTATSGAAGMSCCDGGASTEAEGFSVRLLAVVYVGSFFGAIHCAAWSFSFPSYAEKVLWRTSSLGIVISLICCIGHIQQQSPLIFIENLLQRAGKDFARNRIWVFMSMISSRNNSQYVILGNNHFVRFFSAIADFASVSSSVLAIVIYIIARMTLIVLALLQFRSLPPLALCTVNWTTFIPHI
ncbi:uncharacterized protein ARMOST_12375 [Armillaria ostoyae]|uniref:Uncharacterized protein n=1 Tax=Armillaria ostoyae TaxID=47428 RepID=A0A284RJR6_ARMOS|nr:uncharacterized protein ARMOST_12375 [Armillaria ostoyae]